MRPDSSKVILRSSTLEYCNTLKWFYRNYTNSTGNSLEFNRKSTQTVRPVELVRPVQICESVLYWYFPTSVGKPLCNPPRATMGNSVFPVLRNSANHGLRDVGSAEPSREVERPSEDLEINRKSQDTNGKSQQQLRVPPTSYISRN